MAQAATDVEPAPSGNAAASKPAPDAPMADGERLIATIYFPDGGSALSDHDRDILRQVADIYRKGATSVRVIGHSSRDGGDQSQQKAMVNYKTSLDRASAIAGALVESGVPRDALSVDARGANEPRYAESTRAGVAGNRRAEIFLTF
jgi:outer membrane protein OmpA-like peptidoglycan-associated protein